MSPECLLPSSGSVRPRVWEQTWFEDFQDGQHGIHFGYQNEMILAILNLYVTPIPPITFQLNQTYGLEADIVWRFFKMAEMVAILDSGMELF